MLGCSKVHEQETIKYIPMKVKYSAWQGVATDGREIFITSDRDQEFKLSNTISVYAKTGEYIRNLPNAYSRTDPAGNFMSFGDCTYIDGFLFIPVYNFNSGAKQKISRVAKYSLPNLKLVSDYDIGEGTAESVTKNNDYFWVVYHDRNYIKQYDLNFKLLHTYPLSQRFESEGGYQGVVFVGNNLYVNLHGSNNFNEKYAQGLDHYRFDGEKFIFIKRIKPPVYGAGQGIEFFDGQYYWADRPGNQVIITNTVK